MKYKIGDIVLIKSLDWYNANKNKAGTVRCDDESFTYYMSNYCGKIATIIETPDDEYYILDIDDKTWCWTDGMFDESDNNMEKRNIKIDINTAKEWYNSGNDSLKTIALQAFSEDELSKVEVKFWDDLLRLKEKKWGYYIHTDSSISGGEKVIKLSDINLFIDKKHVQAALAIVQISQLMPYYGGEITDEEWKTNKEKYSIYRENNRLATGCFTYVYKRLSFHTHKQCNDFLKYNEQLVKDYLMI